MIQLTCRTVAKRYGATRALDGLSMELRSGEVVGIAGPNGAGKSTLMRVLAGEEEADSGEIVLTMASGQVDDVWRRVAVVHQEPHIWPNMTVEQNLAVGRESNWFGRIGIDPRSVEAVLSRLGILHYRDHELCDLSLAVQQRVEIARAMLRQADVYLFDEPNSALTEQESQALFATMEQLAADDKIVLLITHRLNDFVRCCKRVMVLRDGRITGDLATDEVTEQAIAAELTTQAAGADAAASRHRERARDCHGTPLLILDGCRDHAGGFAGISLKLMPGRVVALAGVEGSGARELAQAIGRYRELSGGEQHASTDRRASVAYLAASRRDTVFRNLTVRENMVARLGRRSLCGRSGLLDLRQMEELARRSVQQYRVKAGSLSSPITSLSGGNQQKVVLGAAMEQGCDIIVIEEPTRGVDISSKADIYALLRSYAAAGRSVVMFCTEVQEMFDAADEVVVLSRGRIVGHINLSEIEDIPALADLMALYENFQDELLPPGAAAEKRAELGAQADTQ